MTPLVCTLEKGPKHLVHLASVSALCGATKEGATAAEIIGFLCWEFALQPSWPLTGVIRALRARNPKKVEKKLPGPLGPGVKKG